MLPRKIQTISKYCHRISPSQNDLRWALRIDHDPTQKVEQNKNCGLCTGGGGGVLLPTSRHVERCLWQLVRAQGGQIGLLRDHGLRAVMLINLVCRWKSSGSRRIWLTRCPLLYLLVTTVHNVYTIIATVSPTRTPLITLDT